MAKDKTLRVPKNKRSFNIWESKALNETLQKTTLILNNIDKVAEEEGYDKITLGTSAVPVVLLYEVCEAYNILYEKLLKEQLIKTANPKIDNNIH